VKNGQRILLSKVGDDVGIPARDNHLYKKRPDRYLTERRFKPVTVCIAAIANVGAMDEKREPIPPAIVFCADKLVSAGVQYESFEAKIKKITDYCYAMQSSDNAMVSDLILERVKQKVGNPESPLKIEEIVKLLRKECFDYKKEWFEDNVLWKYNLAFEKFKATPEKSIADSIKEIGECPYSFEFQFIILGIEPSKEAHIFAMNQDGAYLMQDYLGFSTIGAGSQLAFPQMTKYAYSRYFPLVAAIPMVYISKKIAERMQGVGQLTDLAVLHFGKKEGTPFLPAVWVPSTQPDFMVQLDKAYDTITKNEKTELENVSKKVQEWLQKPPPQPQT
jgi:20S proteasome alpha/beta subunit